MIEIIPNWHPLLVHFTVGLLSTSVLFYLASACLSITNSWKQQWLNMANWSLWSGCLFAMGTAFAGWLAYNSVAHDSASHAAMTLHRNWALPTASSFLLLGVWAIFIARKNSRPGFLFLTYSILAAGALMVTGWLGAEAVYRYGLGVKSLPVAAEGTDGHNHSHGTEHDESVMGQGEHPHSSTEIEQPTQSDGHQHEHESKKMPPNIEHNIKTTTDINTEPTIKPSSEIEQPTQSDGHQHEHGEQAILPATEQPPKQDGHQHEHESKKTPPNIEHNIKTTTDFNTEPTIKPSSIESHAHGSNSVEATPAPLNQDEISVLLSPSELHSSNHEQEQFEEEILEKTHDHDHEH